MSTVNITGFQRARRLKALKAVEDAKVLPDQNEPENGQNQQPSNAFDVDALTVDEVKAKLDELGISYAHNTGVAKLREKLSHAINGPAV